MKSRFLLTASSWQTGIVLRATAAFGWSPFGRQPEAAPQEYAQTEWPVYSGEKGLAEVGSASA